MDLGIGEIVKTLREIIVGLLKKRQVGKIFIDAVKIREIGREIVMNRSLNVDFFFLLMAHNGNHKLIPHGFKYRSIVDGFFFPEWMPNFKFENYRNLIIEFE